MNVGNLLNSQNHNQSYLCGLPGSATAMIPSDTSAPLYITGHDDQSEFQLVQAHSDETSGPFLDASGVVDQPDNVDPRSIVSNLVKMFGLSVEQYQEILVLLQLGPSLHSQDVSTRAFIVATCRLQNTITNFNQGITKFGHILDELKNRLDTTFTITETQKAELNMLAREAMFNHNTAARAGFRQLHKLVQAAATERATMLKLPTNMTAANGKILFAHIGRACSTVRQCAFRDIESSVTQGIHKPLEEAIQWILGRFSRPGSSNGASKGQTAVIVILRYLYDVNRDQVISKGKKNAVDEVANTNDLSGVDDNDFSKPDLTDHEAPANKKRKTAKGLADANVNKRKTSYWAIVDKFFTQQRKIWGDNMGSPGWVAFIEKRITEDRRKWPQHIDPELLHFTQHSDPQPPLPSPTPTVISNSPSPTPSFSSVSNSGRAQFDPVANFVATRYASTTAGPSGHNTTRSAQNFGAPGPSRNITMV
ncbi:hypothetical protein FRC03_011956 [Tulasnella sp. 419]|nr:hypothetical protein FRC03_011956 [Tulasnella sp. 419]